MSETGEVAVEESEDQKVERLKDVWAGKLRDDGENFWGQIIDKVDEIRKNHPDYQKYRLYHLLVGSTPEKDVDKFDFPGRDSVEEFLDPKEKPEAGS